MNHTTPPFQGRGFGFAPAAHGYYQSGAPALAWATFALVLLLVLLFGAVLIARLAGGGRRRRRHMFGQRMMMRGPGGPPDALEVLRMRFASGQISRDEFLQATGDLTAQQPPPPPPPA